MRNVAVALTVTLAALAAAAAVAAKPAPPPGPVQVTTSFAPTFVYFADRVTAQVTVDVDRSRADLGSVAVKASFGQWEQLGATRTQTVATRDAGRHTEWFMLVCLSSGCMPRGTVVQRARMPPVEVTARALDGATLTVRQPWAEMQVAGRFLPPASGSVRPALRRQIDLPAATYRVDPSALALALDVAGALGLAIALGLAGLEAAQWWLARRRGHDTRPPLVRALALVRDARGRDVEDRRRAAGLLARLLHDRRAAAAAAAVAWSRADPSPHALEELAATVESAAEERA